MNTIIWVVTARSAKNPQGHIFYWWFNKNQKESAYRRMIRRHQKSISTGKPQVLRLMRLSVPVTDPDEITEFLDTRTDQLADTVSAWVQLIPFGAHPDTVPTGGTRYPGKEEEIERIIDNTPPGENPF